MNSQRPALHPKFRLVLGLLLVALGLLGATSLSTREFPLALFGKRATGTVKNVEVIQTSTASKWEQKGSGRKEAVSRGGNSTFMDIVFDTTDGKAVEIRTLATFNTEARVGDVHSLIYLPWKPENAKIYSAGQLWMPMGIGSIFTAVCLILGYLLLRRSSAVQQTGPHHARRPTPSNFGPASNSGPINFPGVATLYHIDRPFGLAARIGAFAFIVAAGIKWATQPVPSVVKIEISPFEVWAAQWGPTASLAVAAFALIVLVRRYLWLKNVLGQGVALKGIVEEVDVYERENSHSETTPAFQRSITRTYFVVVRYGWKGEEKKARIRLPYSPFTYQLTRDGEVDLIALDSAPHKPLIRAVYLNQIGAGKR